MSGTRTAKAEELTDEQIALRDAPDEDPFEDEEDILLETEFFDGSHADEDKVVDIA